MHLVHEDEAQHLLPPLHRPITIGDRQVDMREPHDFRHADSFYDNGTSGREIVNNQLKCGPELRQLNAPGNAAPRVAATASQEFDQN
jgi:hypothetical protein